MPIYLGDTEVNKVYLGATPFDNIQNGASELWTNAIVPTVVTNSASSITAASMTANGNVTSDGGATITERGFYFGTSTSALSNTKYTVSGTTGAFSRSMTGLSGSTTYRIFAFATNAVGTTY